MLDPGIHKIKVLTLGLISTTEIKYDESIYLSIRACCGSGSLPGIKVELTIFIRRPFISTPFKSLEIKLISGQPTDLEI